MNTDTTSPLQTAQLDATPRTDAAGNPLTRFTLTLGSQRVFQDVDQWGLPYDGSPNSDLYSDLCDWLTVVGRLDADALNAL